MQYYCFNLDKESQQYCVMSTPFGLYKYLKAPMGVSQSPDFAQSVMDELLIEFRKWVETFLDDVGIFTQAWSEHIQILTKVLTILEKAGFTINPLKCEWAVKETDWLGYWFTPTGIKPFS